MSTKLQFDEFQIDTEQPALFTNGTRVEIAAQPLRLLALLVSRQGDIVSHAEICEHLWGTRVVDFSNGLHVCIRQIRVALGDSASSPRYVQNVPRKGYRFLRRCTSISEDSPESRLDQSPGRAGVWTGAVVVLLVLGMAALPDRQTPDLTQAPVSTERSAAVDAYRRGQFLLTSGEEGAIERSRSFFRRAIDTDPEYAPAYAAMAETFQLEAEFEQARPYAERALRLDDGLAEAHLRVAAVAALGDWDWQKAELAARRALALAPDSSEAYHALATVFSVTGRMDLAIDAMQRAMTLDPASTLLHADYGMYLYYQGDLEGARARCEEALELDPSHYASTLCAYNVAVSAGEYARAMAYARDMVRAWERSTSTAPPAGLDDSVDGVIAFERWRLELYRDLQKQSAVSPVAFALVFAALDDRAQALHYLEQSLQSRETMMPFILADPAFESLRDESRFRSVLRAANVQLTPATG